MKKIEFKSLFRINRALLPIKATIFLFSSSAFAILPYLTIHMIDIGITVDQVALIYAILPFTVFVAPAAVGFLADKLGNFTRVLMLTLAGSAVLHTALLFLPTVNRLQTYPLANATFMFVDDQVDFNWKELTACDSSKENKVVAERFNLNLTGCSLDCPINLGICESVTNMFICTEDNSGNVNFRDVTINISNGSANSATGALLTGNQKLQIAPGCQLRCQVIKKDLVGIEYEERVDHVLDPCETVSGNPLLTVILYFVFRSLATMCLGCNFVLIDAQTIQVCKREEEMTGQRGALGRQFLFQALAQAIISPLVGKIMDALAGDGPPNYLFPFIAQDAFIFLTLILLCFTSLDIQLPKTSGWEGIKQIFKSLDICVFLVLMFVCGCLWGFIETFLFIYLKNDMGAPMYLLGLTITTGAVVSIPFLYVSDWIVEKMGIKNVFLVALLMYAVRYTGYSYITSPWLAFPFEGLELFTIQLMKIATVQYIGINAPKGLLATLNGIAGGVHYGMGKGCGSLVGGYLISVTGNTALVYRYFGVFAAVCGLIYFIYEFLLVRICRIQTETQDSGKDQEENAKPFLEKTENKTELEISQKI